MRFYNWFLRNLIMPLGEIGFQHPMLERLRFLEEAQWWDVDRLHRERNRLLSSVIEISYREVPFYRKLFEKAGIKPDDIKKPEDLQRVSVVTKEMLGVGYPKLTTRKTGYRTYEVRTSGSTGTNFKMLEDSPTAAWYRASFMLALGWAGWEIGEKHLQTGMTVDRSLERKLKDTLLRCYYISAYDLSNPSLDRGLELMDKCQIRHLFGYPGSLYYLARRALEKGWNKRIKSIVTWGDNLFPFYRKTIEEAFKTRVFDTYGCAEGIQISAQCGLGQTYHIHVLDAIVEFVDEVGQPVLPGQPGNVVLTRLYPGPMPLIRYRIGDMAIGAGLQRCHCGRGYDLIAEIEGRDTDVVITPNGNRLIVHFFTGILEHFPEIDSFQIIQEAADMVVVRVVPAMLFDPQTRSRIRRVLQEKGLEDMRIELEVVREIPLTTGGKRRFVINYWKQRETDASPPSNKPVARGATTI